MTKIKLGLNGAYGKMGMAIQELLNNNDDFDLIAKIGRDCSIEEIKNHCNECDVIIDFSSIRGLENLLECASKNNNTKLLIGTTGLSKEHFEKLEQIAKSSVVLYAANMSLGPNLVAQLAAHAAKILKQYDIEIIEKHHRYKKDAPSGTALMIGREIAKAKGINVNKFSVFGRGSFERKDDEIGFASIRAGGIYGEHEVIFANNHEIINIGTRALSRQSFAQSALFVAKWLCKQNSPDLYSMKDVIKELI